MIKWLNLLSVIAATVLLAAWGYIIMHFVIKFW